MKSKGLLTASFLLLVLSGIIWWSNKKAATAEKPPASTATVKLLTVPEDQIQEIEIKKRAGDSVHLRRIDSKWQLETPEPLRADPDTVSGMISSLSSLSSDRTVEEKATSLDQYGLTQPPMEVNITDKDKKSTKLLIGDDTPAGSAVYAAIAGDPRVFVLSSYKKNGFDKSANDLRDKRLLIFDSDKVSNIELTAKKQTIAFGRTKDEWQIVKPKPLRADRFQVEELLRTLHDAKMDLSASEDNKKTSAAFSSGTPFVSIKVTDVSGTQELQVRKNKDDYYAKSSAVAGVYHVSGGTSTGMDKSLDDFRNKKLFDFGFTEPDKVELHDGTKSYSLTHNGNDWWSNGTKMDPGTVSALIDKTRDLSASGFAETGLATQVLELTVTSDSGRRVEKVSFSKNGDKFLAKRENEPALYELNASAVEELQKSAADLKPATVPTPPSSKK
ncbi:MAG TPA: DUF4340 domain-containing protein [Candidatus Acidoferrum sp.]|nr:DUF4340 domain-containing protein [Candidatus Acidoferrum sp.]